MMHEKTGSHVVAPYSIHRGAARKHRTRGCKKEGETACGAIKKKKKQLVALLRLIRLVENCRMEGEEFEDLGKDGRADNRLKENGETLSFIPA